MSHINLLNGIKTDIELSFNDLFRFLYVLSRDNRNLKLKAFEPNKKMAEVFLEYLYSKKNIQKKRLETAYKKELKFFNEWLKIYCEENNCSKKEALLGIIER